MALKKMLQSVLGLTEYQLYEDRRRAERITMFFILIAVAGIAILPAL